MNGFDSTGFDSTDPIREMFVAMKIDERHDITFIFRVRSRKITYADMIQFGDFSDVTPVTIGIFKQP